LADFAEYAPDKNPTHSSLSFYPYLLAAIDGAISPFSTLAIEAASFGNPILTLAYNHPNHANFNWRRQGFELHNLVFRHSDWSHVCDSPELLIDGLLKLIDMSKDHGIRESARGGAEVVFRRGSVSAAERILAAMEDVVLGKDADESLVFARKDKMNPEFTAQQQLRDKDG
jgi:hypothetical protein